jgi:hypothetical protein
MRALVIIIPILFGGFGCSIAGRPVETREQLNALPNSHSFPLPIQKIRSVLLQNLQVIPERDDPFYRKYGFVERSGAEPSFVVLKAEEKETALFGEKFFSDPANAKDLYVHTMGISVLSSYYRTSDGPLSYSVEFALSLNALDVNNTNITVRSFGTSVGNGKVFNAHAFGYIPKSISVPPARAEEYKLLVYIAHLLGAELPPLD